MLKLKLETGGLCLGVTRQFVMFIKIEHAYCYEYFWISIAYMDSGFMSWSTAFG